MAQPKIIADFEAQLATAISVGSTSFSLSTATDDDGVALPAGLYYFTIDNGSSSKEYLAGTLSGTSVTGVVHVSRQGVETSGANTAHRIGSSVILTDYATYMKYIDNATLSGAVDATLTAKGLLEVATQAEIDAGTPTGGTGASVAVRPDQLALSIYATRLPSAAEKTALAGLTNLTGAILPYAGRSAPTGYLACDGSAISRSTYATLFAILAPSQTFTVTQASPAVFTATAHGLVVGDKIHITTTGGLYSGLATNTDYYVISAGLTADNFEVALSPGGTAINTTGSQSGVHTLYKSAWGKGDGSTTFNVPDLRSKTPIGLSASAPTYAMNFDPGQRSGNVINILDTVFPSQGQAVVLSTTGALPTGLSPGTYYIIRVSSTSISFATTQANANAGTAVSLSGAGSGVNTMTFTLRAHTVLGRNGGEESHALAKAELAAHVHPYHDAGDGSRYGFQWTGGGSRFNTASGGGVYIGTGFTTDSTGSDTPQNNMSPFAVVNYIIKT